MKLMAPMILLGASVLVAGLGRADRRPRRVSTLRRASHAAINTTVIDQTRNSYKFFLGYEFLVFLGVEAAWVNFGKFDA